MTKPAQDAGADPAPRLGGRAARGVMITTAGQGARLLVQIAGTVLLARVLAPGDFGLLAMVLAVVGIGEVLRDFGLSSAAVQASRLTHAQQSNLFWVNAAIGATLTIVAALTAPLISDLYGDDRLTAIARAVSVTFLLNGLATQARARLLRCLRFGAVATTDATAVLVGVLAGVLSAVLGAGYWALVCQQVAQAAIASAMFIIWARWIPSPYRRATPMEGLYAFGASYALTQMLGYGSRNVDSLLIGARFGARELGYYNRAFQLLTLPLNQINGPATNVALPVLSRLQDDPKRLADYLLRGQSVLLHVVLGIFVVACAQADSLIPIALGDQWDAAVPIFQVLCIAGAFQTAGFVTYWCFLALGRVRHNLYFALATRPLLIAGIVAGSQFGTIGVAWSYSLGLALLWPAGLLWLRLLREPLPIRRMFTNGLALLCAYGVIGTASWACTVALNPEGPWMRLGLGLAAATAAAAVVAAAVSWYRTSIKELVLTFRLARRGTQTSSPVTVQ